MCLSLYILLFKLPLPGLVSRRATAGIQALPVCIDMFKRRLKDRSGRPQPKLTLIVIAGTTRVESREDLKAVCAEVEVCAHSKEREPLSLYF